MTTAPNDDPDRRDPLDPLGAYLDCAPGAADAVRPDEPRPEQWDAVLRAVRARLTATPATRRAPERRAALAVGGVVLAAVAVAVAWLTVAPFAIKDDVAKGPPAVPAPELPADPLAEYDVLPMATAAEVDLARVPGSGWLPVGADPLPDVLVLASSKDVELDDPDETWPEVTRSPTDAPMIFAAKPR